ncbi:MULTISPECIES: CdaR family protein [unclassified Enterococcus]|uniref:CdaR family protein n=1 Tax=unclassified Enterococcus TaxID=2608891 RepID=UPI0013EC945E|nr:MULTISPECIES: CdaR family protein [unclassified Enterococcus]
MISKEKRTSILYGFVALLFSIVLYFNANGQTVQNTLSGNESYSQTVADVPVQLSYDSDRYYIHGYENAVTVKLSSANRVQLNAEKNEDTRTFRVTADITKLSEGTHEVPLKIQNLSSAVTAKMQPATITVTIEKKVTKDFEVEAAIPSTITPTGYELDEAVVKPDKVTITTGDKTLAEIKRVVANVDKSMITDTGINAEIPIQALNAAGEVLSIVSDPVQVSVKAEAIKPSKTVRLYGTQQGTPAEGVESYDFSFSDLEAEVTGSNELLSTIGSSIAVPVDITGINHRTTRKIEIPVETGLTVEPRSVSVEITPVLKSSSSSSSTSQSIKEESGSRTTSASSVPSVPTSTTTPSSTTTTTSGSVTTEETSQSISESTQASRMNSSEN